MKLCSIFMIYFSHLDCNRAVCLLLIANFIVCGLLLVYKLVFRATLVLEFIKNDLSFVIA